MKKRIAIPGAIILITSIFVAVKSAIPKAKEWFAMRNLNKIRAAGQ